MAVLSVLALLPIRLSPLAETLVDVGLLALVAIPLIYLWVARPFITAHSRLLEEVTHLAYHDSLTRLPNRRLLAEQLDRTLASCRRRPSYCALLMLDLDNFKKINDKHGHALGDEVLVVTAQRLQKATRGDDLIVRFGGDEFVLLLQHVATDADEARATSAKVAEKLLQAVNEPIEAQGLAVTVGASIGLRILGPESVGSESLIRDVDAAMYRMKAGGGGGVAIHEEARRVEEGDADEARAEQTRQARNRDRSGRT